MTAAARLSAVCLFVLLAGVPRSTLAQPADVPPLTPLPLNDLGAFRATPGARVAGGAWALWDSTGLVAEPGRGVLVLAEGAPLATTWEHGDLEVELEYLVPAGARAALVLQGRYAVQLADSWGVARPRFTDAGGVARRAGPERPPSGGAFEGHAPRANASRAPGLWHQLRLVFAAPRFDAAGRKTTDARLVEVVLNGVKVQENVAVGGPTEGAVLAGERPAGPLVFRSDHGAAAFRNVRYRGFDPVEPVRVSDVRYRFYPGEFSRLDEVAAAEPARAGELHGYVWNLFGNTADRFGAAWEGQLHVPQAGTYRFEVGFNWVDDIPYEEDAVPGHGRLTVDGREVVSHTGAAPYASGSVALAAGTHPFTLTYFKNRRLWRPIVFVRVEGPGMAPQYLNAPRTLPEPESVAPPLAVAPLGEPYVLRSFVLHGGEKKGNAVSVGDPRGVHYTLDLERGGLLYAWKGAFADVGSMWYSRGEQQVALPLGHRIDLPGGPALAALATPDAPWPEAAGGYRFGGYTLDAGGRPTFRYRLGGVSVEERLDPSPDGRTLTRRLVLPGGAPDGAARLWLRAAEGADVQARRPGVYSVDGRYFVRLEGGAGGAVVRTHAGRQELLVPVSATGGAEAAYTLLW